MLPGWTDDMMQVQTNKSAVRNVNEYYVGAPALRLCVAFGAALALWVIRLCVAFSAVLALWVIRLWLPGAVRWHF